MVQILEERPPYVQFEVRAVEDRQASIEAGHWVGKDVVYAIITPVGSKDKIERVATEWLDQCAQAVKEERMPRAWLEAFRGIHKDYLEGRDPVTNGTAVTNWPAASPAQIKAMQSVGVRTVEDMAAANEETLARIGMGGRALKDQAKAWLDGAANTGKQAAELAALQIKAAQLEEANTQLHADLKAAQSRIAALETKK